MAEIRQSPYISKGNSAEMKLVAACHLVKELDMSSCENIALSREQMLVSLRVHHNQQWVGYVEKCRL